MYSKYSISNLEQNLQSKDIFQNHFKKKKKCNTTEDGDKEQTKN